MAKKKTSNKKPLSQYELFALLKKRYSAPEYAIFPGVQNSTGYRRSNEADGVAMSLWPSRGLEVLGFEIKSYRNDWLSELRKPQKSDAIQKYCDRWWIVAANKEIVNLEIGELPPTWGLMVAAGSRLVTVVDAPKLESKALDRGFLAALLRRAHESTKDPKLEHRLREEIRKELESAAEVGSQSELKLANQRIERLESEVKKYEEAIKVAGLPIGSWGIDSIAKAVNFIRYGRGETLLKELVRTRSIIDGFSIEINDTVDELQKLKEKNNERK